MKLLNLKNSPYAFFLFALLLFFQNCGQPIGSSFQPTTVVSTSSQSALAVSPAPFITCDYCSHAVPSTVTSKVHVLGQTDVNAAEVQLMILEVFSRDNVRMLRATWEREDINSVPPDRQIIDLPYAYYQIHIRMVIQRNGNSFNYRGDMTTNVVSANHLVNVVLARVP